MNWNDYIMTVMNNGILPTSGPDVEYTAGAIVLLAYEVHKLRECLEKRED